MDLCKNGFVQIWPVKCDPEVLAGVVNEGDVFSGGRRDVPGAAGEVEGVIGIEPASELDGEVDIQRRDGWCGVQSGAFFLERQIPGGVGGSFSWCDRHEVGCASGFGFGARRWRI